MKTVKITGVSENNKFYNKIGTIERREDILTLKATGERASKEAYIIKVEGIGEVRLEPHQFEECNEPIPALKSSVAGILAAIWGGRKWNGKIYRDAIYVDGDKVVLTPETLRMLQQRPTPEQVGAKKIKSYEDLSSRYGVPDSDLCTVTEWELNGETFKTVSHAY